MALGKQLREARERQGLTASQVAAATRMKTQTVEAIEREDFSKMAAPIYGKGFIKLYAELVGADPRPLLQEYTQRISVAEKAPSLVSERGPRRSDVDPAQGAAGAAHPAAAPLHPDESHVQIVAREVPAAAPDAGAPEEPDLFSHASRRMQDAGQAGIQPLPEQAPPAAARPDPEESAPVPASGPDVAGADWGARLATLDLWQSPLRAASIVLGLVLLILLVISTLSRCVVSPGPAQGSAQSTELQVVVQPPEPYFE
jgi:transcriptional regulator with XRE-family HTH domain